MPLPDFERTAIAVAAKLGIVSDVPIVLAEGMSTVVHLRPSPIVGRVTRLTHLVRPVDGVTGTIALARALPGLVVPPSDQVDPGPHVADGRYVTFWAYVEAVPATPVEAGSSLRAFHQEARRFGGKLRSFDPRPEALRIADLVGGQAGAVLQAAAASIPLPQLAEQPVHGDAHLGNALAGGRWLDLDEACLGPPEWDLACVGTARCSSANARERPATRWRRTAPMTSKLSQRWTRSSFSSPPRGAPWRRSWGSRSGPARSSA